MARRHATAVAAALAVVVSIVAPARADVLPPISPYPVPVAPCAGLRIAPVQAFAPYGAAPYLLHGLKGYQDASGTLMLEAGMRVAAVSGGCPTATSDGHAIHYGLTISIQQGASTYTVATELEPDAGPVALPAALDPAQPATLTYSQRKWTCVILGVTPWCNASTELSSGSYAIVVAPRGSYASASYSRTTFTVDDNVPDGKWQPTHVTSLTLDDSLAATPVSFTAKGWPVVNGASLRPQVGAIGTGDDFAIYRDDFSNPHDPRPNATALAKYGVTPAAGLQWPRATGTRNGGSFSYSVDLPILARDAISFCWFAPPTFYHLPFKHYDHWYLANGNYDDPDGGHPDNGKTTIGNNQKYAFDFVPDANLNGVGEVGAPIVAARNGIVVDRQAFQTQNSWNGDQNKDGIPDGALVDDGTNVTLYAPTGSTSVGNFVILEHEDATFGVYWHFKPSGVIVQVGDYVERGDTIGYAGYTGNASMPHLHFDVRGNWDTAYPGSGIEYPTIPVRFKDLNHPSGCWLPRDADPLDSNNG
ncbi:MAG TPA: M23 family metallopeptidase [Gaiellaceae bacterium]